MHRFNCWIAFYRPQTKFAKVMFLHVSVCPWRGGGEVVPLHALQVSTWVVSQHALQVSLLTPKGELEGSDRGGSPGLHLGGGLQAHTWWGLQAYTWGSPGPQWGFSRVTMGVSMTTPGGSPCQHLGGLQAHTQGVYSSIH